MRLTINDIAKKAKVSKSTVSRVLNNSGYVNKDTREKIERVIRENAYYPSAQARSLSKRESNTIGVIIPEADKIGKPLNEIALNWLRQKEEVTSIIAGASSVSQLEKNIHSTTWDLTHEELSEIETIIEPYRYM